MKDVDLQVVISPSPSCFHTHKIFSRLNDGENERYGRANTRSGSLEILLLLSVFLFHVSNSIFFTFFPLLSRQKSHSVSELYATGVLFRSLVLSLSLRPSPSLISLFPILLSSLMLSGLQDVFIFPALSLGPLVRPFVRPFVRAPGLAQLLRVPRSFFLR